MLITVSLPPWSQSYSDSRKRNTELSLDRKTVKVTMKEEQVGWKLCRKIYKIKSKSKIYKGVEYAIFSENKGKN